MKIELVNQAQIPLTLTQSLSDSPPVENLFCDFSKELELYDDLYNTLLIFKYDLTDSVFEKAEKAILAIKDIHQNGNLHPFFYILIKTAFEFSMRHPQNQKILVSLFTDALGSFYSLESVSSQIKNWLDKRELALE